MNNIEDLANMLNEKYIEVEDLRNELEQTNKKLRDAEMIMRVLNDINKTMDSYFLKYYSNK